MSWTAQIFPFEDLDGQVGVGYQSDLWCKVSLKESANSSSGGTSTVVSRACRMYVSHLYTCRDVAVQTCHLLEQARAAS